MWSQMGMALSDIRTGDIETAEDVHAVIDRLILDFNDHPGLPQAVFQVGEEYWNEGFRCENAARNDQAKECFRKALGVWERVIAELPESPTTTQAYYLSARCYEKAGDYSKAIAFSRTVVEKWPEHQFAWNAQFCIASCYQELVWSGQIPMEEGAPKVRQACEELLAKYPQSMAAPAARDILKRWQSRPPQ